MYRETVVHIGRSRRGLLAVIEYELSKGGFREPTPIQAMLLFGLRNGPLCAADLYAFGVYTGTNVNHNIKVLEQAGYLERTGRGSGKKRVPIALTARGRAAAEWLQQAFVKHAATISATAAISEAELAGVVSTLTKLENFWRHQVQFKL